MGDWGGGEGGDEGKGWEGKRGREEREARDQGRKKKERLRGKREKECEREKYGLPKEKLRDIKRNTGGDGGLELKRQLKTDYFPDCNNQVNHYILVTVCTCHHVT